MATGPDPNRWHPTDPDLAPEEEAEGEGMSDPEGTRLGLSPIAIALLAVALVALFLLLFR